MAEQYEIDRLIFHEGLKLKPYKCTAGKWTIGVGRCYETNPFTAEELKAIGDWEHGITKNAALTLLRNDIASCKKQLLAKFPFYKNLDKERQYALLDMCFQLGIKGLSKFKKMIKALENNNYEQASSECLNSDYAKQTPARAKRIANLIKTGEWA
jgi:lysozyme